MMRLPLTIKSTQMNKELYIDELRLTILNEKLKERPNKQYIQLLHQRIDKVIKCL